MRFFDTIMLYLGSGYAANDQMAGIFILLVKVAGILFFVFFGILWLLFVVLYFFSAERNKYATYFTKNIEVLLESVFTLFPVVAILSVLVSTLGFIYNHDFSGTQTFFDITAVGRQWYWTFYIHNINLPLFRYYSAELFNNVEAVQIDSLLDSESNVQRLLEVTSRVAVPISQFIGLNITSADVIHSFAVPQLGIKIDAIPGHLARTTLCVQFVGVYRGECSELCGAYHGFMPIVVEALTMPDWLDWFVSLVLRSTPCKSFMSNLFPEALYRLDSGSFWKLWFFKLCMTSFFTDMANNCLANIINMVCSGLTTWVSTSMFSFGYNFYWAYQGFVHIVVEALAMLDWLYWLDWLDWLDRFVSVILPSAPCKSFMVNTCPEGLCSVESSSSAHTDTSDIASSGSAQDSEPESEAADVVEPTISYFYSFGNAVTSCLFGNAVTSCLYTTANLLGTGLNYCVETTVTTACYVDTCLDYCTTATVNTVCSIGSGLVNGVMSVCSFGYNLTAKACSGTYYILCDREGNLFAQFVRLGVRLELYRRNEEWKAIYVGLSENPYPHHLAPLYSLKYPRIIDCIPEAARQLPDVDSLPWPGKARRLMRNIINHSYEMARLEHERLPEELKEYVTVDRIAEVYRKALMRRINQQLWEILVNMQ